LLPTIRSPVVELPHTSVNQISLGVDATVNAIMESSITSIMIICRILALRLEDGSSRRTHVSR